MSLAAASRAARAPPARPPAPGRARGRAARAPRAAAAAAAAAASAEPHAPPSDLKTATAHTRVYSTWEVIRGMKHDETSYFMLFLHAVALATVLFYPLTTRGAVLLGVSYAVRMWVVTCGYHRYFSHRSFKTRRWFQALLGALCCAAGQRGPVWWASMHRHHHRHSDGEQDAHSPRHGFLWSHMGWFMCADTYNSMREKEVPDWLNEKKYPELRWLDDRHHLFFLGSAVVFGALWGLDGLLWGFAVSCILSNHASYGINSLVHVMGSRRFESGDDSRNCWWFALLTHGEGWHNNHHAFPSSARQGLRWFEVDFTYYTLLMLEKLGIVWDLKSPSQAQIERKLLKNQGVAASA